MSTAKEKETMDWESIISEIQSKCDELDQILTSNTIDDAEAFDTLARSEDRVTWSPTHYSLCSDFVGSRIQFPNFEEGYPEEDRYIEPAFAPEVMDHRYRTSQAMESDPWETNPEFYPISADVNYQQPLTVVTNTPEAALQTLHPRSVHPSNKTQSSSSIYARGAFPTNRYSQTHSQSYKSVLVDPVSPRSLHGKSKSVHWEKPRGRRKNFNSRFPIESISHPRENQYIDHSVPIPEIEDQDLWSIHSNPFLPEQTITRFKPSTGPAQGFQLSVVPEHNFIAEENEEIKDTAIDSSVHRSFQDGGTLTVQKDNKECMSSISSPEVSAALITTIQSLCSAIQISNQQMETECSQSEYLDMNHISPKPSKVYSHLRAPYQETDIRSSRVEVEVRVVFLKIGEIDTLKELYYADAFIQAKWREPKLDGTCVDDLTITELEQNWNPRILIDNILSECKETQWITAHQNRAGHVYLIERRRVKGMFMETLELNDFPFDVQDLTITVTTERPHTEVDLIPDQSEMSAINIQSFVDQQEWKLHEHVEISKKIIQQEYSSSTQSHVCFSVTCRAARRPGYFFWNVFLIMFMISSLSFATFAVSPNQAELRLRLSFTLILTSVTFKYVITQSLPKISYLTYMDIYVLMSLAILCIISVWHASIRLFHVGVTFNQSLDQDTLEHIHHTLEEDFGLGHAHKYISSYREDEIKEFTYSEDSHENGTVSVNETVPINPEEATSIETLEAVLWERVAMVEGHVFLSFVIIYVIAHVVFIFWLYFDASKRRRKMRQKDKDYREFIRKNEQWQQQLRRKKRKKKKHIAPISIV